MIAKSDLPILVVSSTLLAVAIYRWDQNTRNVDTSTVLANTTGSLPADSTTPDLTNQEIISTASQSNTSADINSDVNASTQFVAPQTPTTVVIEQPVTVETASPFATHTVRSGDSLSEIAARYNTTVNELQTINGISGSTTQLLHK